MVKCNHSVQIKLLALPRKIQSPNLEVIAQRDLQLHPLKRINSFIKEMRRLVVNHIVCRGAIQTRTSVLGKRRNCFLVPLNIVSIQELWIGECVGINLH